ncbi:MAG TPA: radical SAM protein [Bacteroidales bacterium]|nr:radical SAM protein [Bacteroidales bacterium]HPM18911.1 radical SAM protein [Bacteroidales bacterium]
MVSRRGTLKLLCYAGLAGFIQDFNNNMNENRKLTGSGFEPVYLKLHRNGELKRRGEELWSMMESCRLCPRMCGANRLRGEKGFCGSGSQLEISSFHPHFGEEKPLVGNGGSGTVFMSNCSLRCVFCINWEISQGGEGFTRSIDQLAGMMLSLQRTGCKNINIVTPTHYSPHIMLALDRAAAGGLRLPLVYNTCGWERIEILRMLDGVVDIYLPDFKYSDGKMASKYSSGAESYPDIVKTALLEMHRQAGVAIPEPDGLMYRDLMIRHLVMPNNVSGTREVIDWISENLPKNTYLNLMSQYSPHYKASVYPEISRRITRAEYADAVNHAKRSGLSNLEIQGYHWL